MLLIALKIIACSGLLFGFYHWFLAKESTFIFNRYFLLCSLALSSIIPFITITLPTIESSTKSLLLEDEVIKGTIVENSKNNSIPTENLLLIIYGLISLFMLIRLLRNLLIIKNLKGEKKIYKDFRIKILKNNQPPFSFWNTIYISENYIKDGKIDEMIFLHEKFHLQQKHSVDILLIEILALLSWFNPFLYLYKKAILTNHEFLVDRAVINSTKDLKNYQELIFKEISIANISLSNSFNYNNTKIRFIMMTNKNSRFAKAKKYITLPLFLGLSALFTQKVYASISSNDSQDFREQLANKKGTSIINHAEKPNLKPHQATLDTLSPKGKKAKAAKEKIENIIPPPPPPSIPREFEKNEIVNPVFPGGINQFRNEIANTFDGSVFDGNEGTVKTTITFTIEKDGTTSNIKTEGSNEKFNTESLKAAKQALKDKKWTPATKNGEAIDYHFTLPLTMSFQGFKK